MAFDGDPRSYGLDSGNLWYADSAAGVGHMYDEAKAPNPLDGQVSGAFLTVTSLKDPSKQKGSVHTMEAFSFVSWEAFQRWKATETGSSTGPMVTVRSPRLSRPMKQVEEVASAQRRSRPVACMAGSSRGVWRRLRSPGARSLL